MQVRKKFFKGNIGSQEVYVLAEFMYKSWTLPAYKVNKNMLILNKTTFIHIPPSVNMC